MTDCGTIIVAGISGDLIPAGLRDCLEHPSYMVCSSKAHVSLIKRNYPQFDSQRWIPIVPLDTCFTAVTDVLSRHSVLFLLSGDPLFFGLGKRIGGMFPGANIRYLPALSYMQRCFAHIGMNWEDAEFHSVHGRPLETLAQKITCKKLFVFTDPQNSPDAIAGFLRKRLGDEASAYTVHVGEQIGTVRERFITGSLEDIAAMTFAQPNSMILLDTSDEDRRIQARFGLHEHDIHHSRGLITKDEVRAAVIHRLRLPEGGVFWDIGAGSGSISIEAARLHRSLSVYAVEKNREQLGNISTNRSKYGCRNIQIVDGAAPEILADLPIPDCVFIGGSGGRLEDIIAYLDTRFTTPLHVVVTAVLEKTAKTAPEKLHAAGFDVAVSIIKTSRFTYPEQDTITFNPITIICGTRP